MRRQAAPEASSQSWAQVAHDSPGSQTPLPQQEAPAQQGPQSAGQVWHDSPSPQAPSPHAAPAPPVPLEVVVTPPLPPVVEVGAAPPLLVEVVPGVVGPDPQAPTRKARSVADAGRRMAGILAGAASRDKHVRKRRSDPSRPPLAPRYHPPMLAPPRPLAAAALLFAAACGGSSPSSTSTGSGGAGGTAHTGSTSSLTTSTTGSGGAPWTGPLPEGDVGLAAQHPGDVGLGADPAVLFADDFEGYAQPAELSTRWEEVYHLEVTRIATEPALVHRGGRSLEFELPTSSAELSNAVNKVISPERDVIFLRYYARFEGNNDLTGSSHNGSMIAAHYFIDGMATPGVPADGKNKFLVNLENWRGDAATPSPGQNNVYVYHPEQRSMWGDHFFASGMVLPNSSLPDDFGPGFVPRPDLVPALDQWACYELMVKANTPGARDGRVAFWIDGKLAADFGNLHFRDIDSLKIDRAGLLFHAGANPGADTRKWYDDVVLATSYIGPVKGP